jgi:Flp pilus assembly pilin Flp
MARNERGQGMTEYLIIVALVAISAIAVIRTTSKHLKIGFGKVAAALKGQEYSHAYDDVNETKVQGRSLNDFSEGASSK